MSLKDGSEMYEVSHKLGHKSIETTEDYYPHDPRYQTKSKATADRLMGLSVAKIVGEIDIFGKMHLDLFKKPRKSLKNWGG